jgi:hypothetical protein
LSAFKIIKSKESIEITEGNKKEGLFAPSSCCCEYLPNMERPVNHKAGSEPRGLMKLGGLVTKFRVPICPELRREMRVRTMEEKEKSS